MHDNFYIKQERKQKLTHIPTNLHRTTRENTRIWRKKQIMREQLQLNKKKSYKWNAIEFRDVLKTSKPRTHFFIILWQLNSTQTHSRVHTKNIHPHRQTDRGSVEESKREEIISKQTTTTKTQCWTATSIEDSFMDFNVSFRS